MMLLVVNGHLCQVEQLQDGPPAGFTASNWDFHQFLASHGGCFCRFGTSGKRAENGRLKSSKRRRGYKRRSPVED